MSKLAQYYFEVQGFATVLTYERAVIAVLSASRLVVFLAAVGLREIRRAKVMSQRDLARRAGVSQKTIVDIETGKTRAHPATLRKLAEALGINPEELAEHLPD